LNVELNLKREKIDFREGGYMNLKIILQRIRYRVLTIDIYGDIFGIDIYGTLNPLYAVCGL